MPKMIESFAQWSSEIASGLARALLDLIGPLLMALVSWFILWGQILHRLLSKAGLTGKVYRWLMGISLFSFVPVTIAGAAAVVLGDRESNRGWAEVAGAATGLCVSINWVILMVLAWWPWPSLRKIKGSTPTNLKP